jgi:hypothetical protein
MSSNISVAEVLARMEGILSVYNKMMAQVELGPSPEQVSHRLSEPAGLNQEKITCITGSM